MNGCCVVAVGEVNATAGLVHETMQSIDVTIITLVESIILLNTDSWRVYDVKLRGYRICCCVLMTIEGSSMCVLMMFWLENIFITTYATRVSSNGYIHTKSKHAF
jgi:hypothetical protein